MKQKRESLHTMPTIIQTHLVTTQKAKELEHTIRKYDPLEAALPTLTQGTAVPSLYSHIAQSEDKVDTEIPQPFKGIKSKAWEEQRKRER